MTKTKRQLREEAVERLKAARYTTDSDLLRAILDWGHEPHTGDDSRACLISMLTDDEPPEGDVVAQLRDGMWGDIGSHIADMIERDFVRKDEAASYILSIAPTVESTQSEDIAAGVVRGTCEVEDAKRVWQSCNVWTFMLSCGHLAMRVSDAEPPNHCPVCGKKVAK